MISWNSVTWYSQVAAIVLFVGVFFLGYWLGDRSEDTDAQEPGAVQFPVDVSYACAEGKGIIAIYDERSVSLKLSDGRDLSLPQTISASGIRYANEDESFVFWSKGETAFIVEDEVTTYADCVEAPLPI